MNAQQPTRSKASRRTPKRATSPPANKAAVGEQSRTNIAARNKLAAFGDTALETAQRQSAPTPRRE